MKLTRFIIGLLAFLVITPIAKAGYCSPMDRTTARYRGIYCDLVYANEEMEEDLSEALVEQMGFPVNGTAIIQLIVKEGSEVSCGSVKSFVEKRNLDYEADVPMEIQSICMDQNRKGNEIVERWGKIIGDITNAYENEKVMYQTKKQMNYEFRESEKFWDGQIRDIGDAPFDLIVDLNLIEMILFGSKAQWVSDVFAFPIDSDSDGDDNGNGGADPDDFPLDDEEEEEQDDSSDSDPNEGITIDPGEGGGETEPECVPADHPDADTGDGPNSNYNNPNCGNGILEVLYAEECDDGNEDSGDGCSQWCKKEGGNQGDSDPEGEGEGEGGEEEIDEELMCTDPEAITFQEYDPENSGNESNNGSDNNSNNGSDNNGNNNEPNGSDEENECPPGTFPVKSPDLIGPDTPHPSQYPDQPPNYPGPHVGGTLKQFLASVRPPCPEGYSQAEAQASGSAEGHTESSDSTSDWSTDGSASISGNQNIGINIFGETYEAPICIPTSLCADFDGARKWLFGENWEDDEITVEIATSIEALFCVTLTTANRPLMPYQVIEGCIDCHISAMVDALDKALDTNVTPLKNTTTGFGISSKWGPNFSFNLTTAIKAKLQMVLPDRTQKVADEAVDFVKREVAKVTPLESKTEVSDGETGLEKVQKEEEEKKKKWEAEIESWEEYKRSNNVITDQTIAGRVSPLLHQMYASFTRIQKKYVEMADGLELHDKKACN